MIKLEIKYLKMIRKLMKKVGKILDKYSDDKRLKTIYRLLYEIETELVNEIYGESDADYYLPY